jgi:Escherichia/Staphylococcus phage prohead protease
MEIRVSTTKQSELRFDSASGHIRGYAVKFDRLSGMIEGRFHEVIRAGAFSKYLATGPDVRALVNHDPNLILGRTKSGTLRVWEDQTGLAYDITPPDTQAGRDVVASISRGDLDGSSFAFRVQPGGENWSRDSGGQLREITNATLHDVSVVTYPAYPDSQASMRTLFREPVSLGWYGLESVPESEDKAGERERFRLRLELARML